MHTDVSWSDFQQLPAQNKDPSPVHTIHRALPPDLVWAWFQMNLSFQRMSSFFLPKPRFKESWSTHACSIPSPSLAHWLCCAPLILENWIFKAFGVLSESVNHCHGPLSVWRCHNYWNFCGHFWHFPWSWPWVGSWLRSLEHESRRPICPWSMYKNSWKALRYAMICLGCKRTFLACCWH